MRPLPIEPGRAVLSRQGRDAGRCFVVLATDGVFAWIADGSLRKAEKPKKKKHMHLKALPLFSPAVAEAVRNGKTPMNAAVRKWLADQPPREE